jgi:hypothetical protein
MAYMEGMGAIYVDFSKAFDSIEHEFIGHVLRYYNYGEVMRNMVGTILRNSYLRGGDTVVDLK